MRKSDEPIIFADCTNSLFLIDKTIPLTTLAKPAQPISAKIRTISINLWVLVILAGKIAASIISK